ncbi:hydroxyethylthiazole kinase [Loktanella agnita]|uniref:hydroxyethylthiazole kinase n=1 Tax=Loktanella agnita TaxID=287097 RepID=UPI0039881CB7
MEKPGHYLTAMRAAAPLVQNITNYVSMNVMANVMLAAGASPAMAHAREEAAEFAEIAQALTINIGTPDSDCGDAMAAAAQATGRLGKPWVFDPVAAGATRFRVTLADKLLPLKPTIIRGNASEIMALAGQSGAGRGADAGDPVAAAQDAARALATQYGSVVAVTGPVDFVTDGTQSYGIANGEAIMPKVTALGCALTGVVAAFAVDQPPLAATVAALAYYGTAGEIAAEVCQGPGSFQMHFLDALYNLTPEQLDSTAKITAI